MSPAQCVVLSLTQPGEGPVLAFCVCFCSSYLAVEFCLLGLLLETTMELVLEQTFIFQHFWRPDVKGQGAKVGFW